MEEFLGQLLHFQHFRQFINGRIDKLKGRTIERDLFDNEVLAYEEGEDLLLLLFLEEYECGTCTAKYVCILYVRA